MRVRLLTPTTNRSCVEPRFRYVFPVFFQSWFLLARSINFSRLSNTPRKKSSLYVELSMTIEKSLAQQCKLMDFLLLLVGFKLRTPNKLIRLLNILFRILAAAFNYAELIASVIVLISRQSSWIHWLLILNRSLVPIICHHYFCWRRLAIRAIFDEPDEHFAAGRQIPKLRRFSAAAFVVWTIGVCVSFGVLIIDVIRKQLMDANNTHESAEYEMATALHRIVTGFLAPFYAIYRTGFILTLIILYTFVYIVLNQVNQSLLGDFAAKHASSLGRRMDYCRSIVIARGRLQLVKRTINEVLGLFWFLITSQVICDWISHLIQWSSSYAFKQPLTNFIGEFIMTSLLYTMAVFLIDRWTRNEVDITDHMLLYLATNSAAIQVNSQENEECLRMLSAQVAASPPVVPEAIGIRIQRLLVWMILVSAIPMAVILTHLLPITELNISVISTMQ